MVIWENLWLIWVLSSFSLIRFYVYILAYSTKLMPKPRKMRFGTPKIIFQITTKGNIPTVQETINLIHSVCKERMNFSIAALAIPQNMPGYLRAAFLTSSLLWLLSYQIGAYLNGKYLHPAKRLFFHALTLVSSPVLGLIESSTPILALISRPKTFEVVKK